MLSYLTSIQIELFVICFLASPATTPMLAKGGPSTWLTHAANTSMFANGGPKTWLTLANLQSMLAD